MYEKRLVQRVSQKVKYRGKILIASDAQQVSSREQSMARFTLEADDPSGTSLGKER